MYCKWDRYLLKQYTQDLNINKITMNHFLISKPILSHSNLQKALGFKHAKLISKMLKYKVCYLSMGEYKWVVQTFYHWLLYIICTNLFKNVFLTYADKRLYHLLVAVVSLAIFSVTLIIAMVIAMVITIRKYTVNNKDGEILFCKAV